MLRAISLTIAALGAVVIPAPSVAGCAPEPRTVACSNDAQCHEADERFMYCLESHCVECEGITGCSDGEVCDSGACVECANNRDCGGGQTCIDGVCKAP